MQRYRTEKYCIWRACERFGILPPGLKNRQFDKLDIISKRNLIAYDQVRSLEGINEDQTES